MQLDIKSDSVKVLLLPKYGDLAASGRLRYYQYVPFLIEAGLQVDVHPLFDNQYLTKLFNKQTVSVVHILRLYLSRLFRVLRTKKGTLVIVHCDILPFMPGFLESFLKLRGIPYIYDYDDAIFHGYDDHRLLLVRSLLGKKILRVIAKANAVIAGGQYLFDYAAKANGNVIIIPTVIDIDRYAQKAAVESSEITIGWIGSPSTSRYIEAISGVFSELSKRRPVKLIVVGATIPDIPGVNLENRVWREDSEIDDLLDCDIGIMPLIDDKWSRGKCAYKLIQYMACGLPVVASPVGENNIVVEHGANGFLATTNDEWVEALERLSESADLRSDMGRAGRKKIEEKYTVQSRAPELAQLIFDTARV